MEASKKCRELLGGTVSCLVALSMIVVASCVPLCAGATCLPQNISTGSEAGCHGMAGHSGASAFQAAGVAACQLQDTGFAIVGKTGFAVNSVATAAEFLTATNGLQTFGSDSCPDSVSSSPPGIIPPHTPSFVLRV